MRRAVAKKYPHILAHTVLMTITCKSCGKVHDHRESHVCVVDTKPALVDTAPKRVDTRKPLVDTDPFVVDTRTGVVDTVSRHGVHKDWEARKVQMREYSKRRRECRRQTAT